MCRKHFRLFFRFPFSFSIEIDRKKIFLMLSRDTSRLIVQLQETEQKFDQFYEEHSMELKQCLELRRFECDFRDLQVRKSDKICKVDKFNIITSFLLFQAQYDTFFKNLGGMTEIGDATTRIDQLIEESKNFEMSCQPAIKETDIVIAKGKQIVESNDRMTSKDTVEPKCGELLRMKEMLLEKLAKRFEALTKARDLMERVEFANEWCSRGIELLASQRIENVAMPPETAEIKYQEIVGFVETANFFQLSNLRDFEESTSLESVIVSQVSSQIKDN